MDENYLGVDICYDKVSSKHLLIGLLSRFDNRYQAAADDFFGEISWTQLFCMKGISLFKTAPTIRDMAIFLGCSHQNAAQILRKLCNAGYVSFETDEYDRRKQRLHLTQKASTFLNEHAETADKAMSDIFRDVSEGEIMSVLRIMKKLDDRLSEYEKLRFQRI